MSEALGRSRAADALRALVGRVRSDAFALGAFVVYLSAAYAAILFHFGKDEWFIHTDWTFIVGGPFENLFDPVEQHWSTVPILLHRAYFGLFGANYFPFLATVSGLHLAVVVLLRVILRRLGASAWMASIVAATLPLFGPGYMSIVFSVQITQNLSLALGLSHLLLADHDGPLRRRDWLGLVAGALGLMSSGLSVFLVLCVGVCVLGRRGWRAAAFHTVPLGALYLLWFCLTRPATLAGPDLFRAAGYDGRAHALFVWHGMTGAMSALGHFAPVAICLTLILAIGLFLRQSRAPRTTPTSTLVPLALLGCVPLYLGVLGYQRSSSGADYATYSHHLYTVACFALPALGVGADAVVREWKRLSPLVVGLFLCPIPFNLQAFDQSANKNVFLSAAFLQTNRRHLLAIARSPYASQALHVDRSLLATNEWYSRRLTVGWALDQAKAGRIPDPGPVDPDLDDSIQLKYGITPLGTRSSGPSCQQHTAPIEIHPLQGTRIETSSPVAVINVRHRPNGASRVFGAPSDPSQGQVLRVELPQMTLRLAPVEGMNAFTYCSPSQPAEVLVPTIDAIAALRKAIAADPKALEAMRKAIEADPRAKAEVMRELRGEGGPLPPADEPPPAVDMGSMLTHFAPQTCDATSYLSIGQRCAETLKECWDPMRPMGAAFYFSLPFRLGLPKESLVFLNALLALASLAAGVAALRALLPGATRAWRVALTLGSICVFGFFTWTPLWNSLSDIPAAALLVLSVWLLVLGGAQGKRSLYAASGAALGGAAVVRAFYLYPGLVAVGCLVLLVLLRREKPMRVGLFSLAMMAPIVGQVSMTHDRTGVWSFIDEATRQQQAAVHLENATYGYDTIFTGICAPTSPQCCGYGWPYQARECFRDSSGMGEALRKHEWSDVGCLLLRKQWFYFGSFTPGGRVYLLRPEERHFSNWLFAANMLALLGAGAWILQERKRAWLLATPVVLLGAIWGLATFILPEARFLIAFELIVWTLALAGAAEFALWLRDHRHPPSGDVVARR